MADSLQVVPQNDLPAQVRQAPVATGQVPASDLPSLESAYGTPGQQLLAGVEGLGHGFAGPVSTGIEKGLSKLGVPGLSPVEQEARAQANPATHYGSEVTGFGLGAFTGSGEAALLSKVGEGAVGLAKLGEAASLGQKVAATGIKVGAELAALQTGDEISKAINQDPGQTLGSAAINIGLSGIIGGAGGAVLGSVSPLFKTAANKLGITKFANDFMGELRVLQKEPIEASPFQPVSAEEFIRGRDASTRPGFLSPKTPEQLQNHKVFMTPDGVGYSISPEGDLQNVFNNSGKKGAGQIAVADAIAQGAKTLDAFDGHLPNYYNNFGFNLKDSLKWSDHYAPENWDYAKYGRPNVAFMEYPESLSRDSKEIADRFELARSEKAARASGVPGPAPDLRISPHNGLIDWESGTGVGEGTPSTSIGSTEASRPIVSGAGGFDPFAKRNIPSESPKTVSGTRAGFDPFAKQALPEGPQATPEIPAPVEKTFESLPKKPRPSVGQKAAQWAYANGAQALSNVGGEAAAGTVGGIAGAMAGHPLVGAYIGEKVLAPVFKSLAKPFAENAVNSDAMKASIDYLANAVRGEFVLNNAVKNFFRAGEVIPKFLLPDAGSREKLEKSLSSADAPQNMLKVGGEIGHYMPDHATAAAAIAGTAVGYLNGIKPRQVASSPFDSVPPLDKTQVAKYNRALDVAQQPLVVLQHAKDGTLQAGDVAALQTIYPGLHSAMVQKINNELIAQKTEGKPIPYNQRVGLSLLTGSALDTTMTPQSAHAIINAAGQQQQAVQAVKNARSSKASGAELKAVDKANSLYATSLQQRQIEKRK